MENELPEAGLAEAARLAFGSNVRATRIAEGMTQEALARTAAKYGLQLTQTMIAKIERGDRPTPVPEAVVLAKVLRVPISELFSMEENEREDLPQFKELKELTDQARAAAEKLRTSADDYLDCIRDLIAKGDALGAQQKQAVGDEPLSDQAAYYLGEVGKFLDSEMVMPLRELTSKFELFISIENELSAKKSHGEHQEEA